MRVREEAPGEFVVIARDGVTLDEASGFLEFVEAEGAHRIDVCNLFLRHELRKRGFSGALRSPLVRREPSQVPPVPEQIEQLLPSTTVRARPHRSRWLRLAASAAGGTRRMTRLVVEPLDDRKSIRVHLPERDDQIPEVIALAVDTTLSIQGRFAALAGHVRTISFDHAVEGMATGQVGGAAKHRPGAIHLNAGYSFVSGLERLAGKGEKSLRHSPEAVPASVPSPWTGIDHVVAHELWHEMEFAWEARSYTQTVEFRREIGGWFGLETLERVFTNEHTRYVLAEGVSPYAATNRIEATAEMFALWWCGPPTPGSLAERFGALVENCFPPIGRVQG